MLSVVQHTFIESLQEIRALSKSQEKIKLKQIFAILAGRGYAALLILFSLPFCFPIQIPGFSTPFGILISFLGLRIAFGKHLWWPDWILEKEFTSKGIGKLIDYTIKLFQSKWFSFIHPRLTIFTQNSLFNRFNGILIFFLGIFLALPLPIPLTNLLSAIPLLCIGLGLLEDDGILILAAYILSTICFGAFAFLILYTKNLIAAF